MISVNQGMETSVPWKVDKGGGTSPWSLKKDRSGGGGGGKKI